MSTLITEESDKQSIVLFTSIISAIVSVYTIIIRIIDRVMPAHEILDLDCSSVFFHFNHYGYYLAVHI